MPPSRVAMLEALRPGGDSMFAQFVESFAARAPHHVSAIHAALEAADAPRLVQAAHQLKGSAENLGAVTAGRLCAVLEEAGIREDLDSARPPARHLEDAVASAVRALQERAVAANDSARPDAEQPPGQ
jgi:HPt (histidine-containing phosphotransfer) domain-containing protein